jgi:hypothetical protein
VADSLNGFFLLQGRLSTSELACPVALHSGASVLIEASQGQKAVALYSGASVFHSAVQGPKLIIRRRRSAD